MALHRSMFLRDTAVATAVLVLMYGLAQAVQFAPLQVPGYLIVVGFDVLESTFGAVESIYYAVFGAYLVGLGLLGAAVAHVLRRRDGAPPWRFAAAGAFGVVGAISMLFGASLLVGTDQWVPVAITGATGLALLAVAGWLAGVVDATVTAGRS
jgi:hypothetical protein